MIHTISRGPVPRSGPGTFWAGLMYPLYASSRANRRVMRSSSSSLYSEGSMQRPPFEPPKGTSTMAHLYVISAAIASMSAWVTLGKNGCRPLQAADARYASPATR